MADDAQGKPPTAPLRESLRRFDAVLNFARKLARDSGEAPPGLVEDFKEARKALEREFVLCFEALEPELQNRLRALIKVTRDLDGRQIALNVGRLSHRTRSALNQLVINSDDELSLTEELGEVRYTDSELRREVPASEPPSETPAPPKPAAAEDPRPSVGLRRALIATVLIVLIGGVALTVGYVFGPWWSALPPDNGRVSAVDNTPPDDDPTGGDEPPEEEPFEARAHGYTSELAVQALDRSLKPLDTRPGELTPDELAALLLGLEEDIGAIEPARLHYGPEATRRRLREFADGVSRAAPFWIDDRKPLLDAFAGYVREEARLQLYPPRTEGSKVLLSDVLYSLGGGRFSLVVTMGVMAQACGAPLRLIAPHGAGRPLLAIRLEDGYHTYNGESFGLRGREQPVLTMREMMAVLSEDLRPTMSTSRGRLYCSALFQHFGADFTPAHARAAMADLSPAWLDEPGNDADRGKVLAHRAAMSLQPFICEALLGPGAGGDADEALEVFRLARAAKDVERAERALLLLGERAGKGAMLDGEPLALVVGDLLRDQGDPDSAARWYRRAMEDHPEDPRPVLRLLPGAEGDARLQLMREAYARGERGLGFLRQFADAVAVHGEGLVALALRDEVLARDDFAARDIEQAVLQCLALERTDWALERLRNHDEQVEANAGLQRLELICELSENGLSDRARLLAQQWRERGESDPFIESLLERYGG